MSYLTIAEIHEYCDNIIDGVEPVDVDIASELVDGYLGKTYQPVKRHDRVRLRRNRGRLAYYPVLSVSSVKGVSQGLFGRSCEPLKVEDIDLDFENDGYFTYIGDYGLNKLVLGNKITALDIDYVSGFEKYPKRLKMAVAMLACNIREAKSFAGAKQMTSLDFQVLMSDDSFFTSDIKMLLRGIEKDADV